MKTLIQSLVFAVVVAVSTGCGNPGQSFVGMYSFDGHATFESAAGSTGGDLSGTVNFIEGTTSDIVFMDEYDCALPFHADDWQGQTATVVSGTTCTVHHADYYYTLTYRNGHATRTDGMVSLVLDGDFLIVKGGVSGFGTFNQNLLLNKLGK